MGPGVDRAGILSTIDAKCNHSQSLREQTIEEVEGMASTGGVLPLAGQRRAAPLDTLNSQARGVLL